MTDQELIVWQAKKIVELQTSADYWSHRNYKLEDKVASETSHVAPETFENE